MARRKWTQDNLMLASPEMSERYKPYIRESWDYAVNARASFLEERWEDCDRWAKLAVITAAKALVYSRGFIPNLVWDFRAARDYCYDTFGMRGDEQFTRTELVGEFYRDLEVVGERERKLFRRTVTGATEMVALIECHITAERMPPPERDPHVRYPEPLIRRY